MAWTLNTLPFELTVKILCRTDFSVVARYRQTSRLSDELVRTHAAVIYRRLAFARGLTNSTTLSASVLAPQDPSPSSSFDAEELERVVKGNKSMSDYWQGVKSWEEYCRKRLLLERSWRDGRCIEEDFIVVKAELQDNWLWRFKLDEKLKQIIATGGNGELVSCPFIVHADTSSRIGNIYAINVQGGCDWVLPNADECAHIEYS